MHPQLESELEDLADGKIVAMKIWDAIGGVDTMSKWAKENQTAFYTQIWVKMLSKDNATVTNKSGTLRITWGDAEDAEFN